MTAPTPRELADRPPLTELELDALRVYWREGDYVRTAQVLRISEHALRERLRRVRAKLGVESTIVAIYRLRDVLAA